MEIYDSIGSVEEVERRLAIFLTTSNAFGYSLKVANEINDRQGRNRLTLDYSSTRLMAYSLESDIDEIIDRRLSGLMQDILNTYLSDKQVLPSKPRAQAAMISRVKALFIMLITTNQYGIIPKLNVPQYILPTVYSFFERIREIKDEVIDSWINYLMESGNDLMAERVKSLGNEFWGSEGSKANVIYNRHFHDLESEIKDPIGTYNAYLKYRSEYIKSTKNLIPTTVYNLFDISVGSYNRARQNVYDELSELYPEEEVINRLIFES